MANRLLALSQTYGLASREMSLVAVVTRPGDRQGGLPKTQVVPLGIAHDTDFGAYFPWKLNTVMAALDGSEPFFGAYSLVGKEAGGPVYSRSQRPLSRQKDPVGIPAYTGRPAETAEDFLFDLAAQMDSDGGMPGKNRESRAIATVIAVLAFLSHGHSPGAGEWITLARTSGNHWKEVEKSVLSG